MKVFHLHARLLSPSPPWLFFRHDYLTAQSSDVIYSFILSYKDSDCILAVLNCFPGADEWLSCPSAPFGGILPLENCQENDLAFLAACAREWACRHRAKALIIRTAPACYDQRAHASCHNAYLGAGFYPNHTYSNHYIPITTEAFTSLIDSTEKRRLSKGKKAGLSVSLYCGWREIAVATLLKTCYQAKGYALPVSNERLAMLAGMFPDTFLTFVAHDGAAPVAAAVMVKMGCGVLYHFLSGYLAGYAHLSPSLLLFEAAYEHAQNAGMRLLDLGISIDHSGMHKPSLSSFKSRIGGLVCDKIVYCAEI